MRIRAAGSLESGVRGFQAFAQLAAAWNNKMLIRSPAAGGITLLVHKVEPVPYGSQILRISENQVGLGRRTQRVYVTIGVFSRQNVLTLRERIEEFLIEE